MSPGGKVTTSSQNIVLQLAARLQQIPLRPNLSGQPRFASTRYAKGRQKLHLVYPQSDHGLLDFSTWTSPQPKRTFFWSSKEKEDNEHPQSEKEIIKPSIVENADGTEYRPVPSFSSSLSKVRDGDLNKEEIALKQALEAHQALLDDPDNATSVNTKASLEHLRDCFEKLEYWEESFEAEVELESYANTSLELAHCIFRQGKLHMRAGNIVHANEKYQKALKMFQIERGADIHHADIGNVLVAMAGVHFHRQDPDECMGVLEEAEDHFRKHEQQPIDDRGATHNHKQDPHPDIVKCLDNQGMIYRMQGDFYSALEKFEEALAVVGHSGFEKRQSLQMHIADMLSALDDIDSAIHYYQKILKEDKDRRGSDDETELDAVILHSIGLLHSQQVGVFTWCCCTLTVYLLICIYDWYLLSYVAIFCSPRLAQIETKLERIGASRKRIVKVLGIEKALWWRYES